MVFYGHVMMCMRKKGHTWSRSKEGKEAIR